MKEYDKEDNPTERQQENPSIKDELPPLCPKCGLIGGSGDTIYIDCIQMEK